MCVVTAMLVGVVTAIGLTSEYTHNTIRPTYAATPARPKVLTSKIIVSTAIGARGRRAITVFGTWFVGQHDLQLARRRDVDRRSEGDDRAVCAVILVGTRDVVRVRDRAADAQLAGERVAAAAVAAADREPDQGLPVADQLGRCGEVPALSSGDLGLDGHRRTRPTSGGPVARSCSPASARHSSASASGSTAAATRSPKPDRSAGSQLQAVALDDLVGAVVLLEPAEADEAGDRLVDPLA